MIKDLIHEISRPRFRSYLVGFTRNIFQSCQYVITNHKWFLHILAILISVPLIVFGIDWRYFIFFRSNEIFQLALFPAVMIGSIIPFFFPPIIYLYSKKNNLPSLEKMAFLLTQSAVVGLFWSSFYKAFTGRKGPEFTEFKSGIMDYSQDFGFGFLYGGVFDGWPSGHTTIAWSVAVVYYLFPLSDELPDTTFIRFLRSKHVAFVFAVYVSLGVSTNIHWLSDVCAGILIGISIGYGTFASLGTYDNPQYIQEIDSGKFDQIVKVTFVIIIFIIIFSIFVPRELLSDS